MCNSQQRTRERQKHSNQAVGSANVGRSSLREGRNGNFKAHFRHFYRRFTRFSAKNTRNRFDFKTIMPLSQLCTAKQRSTSCTSAFSNVSRETSVFRRISLQIYLLFAFFCSIFAQNLSIHPRFFAVQTTWAHNIEFKSRFRVYILLFSPQSRYKDDVFSMFHVKHSRFKQDCGIRSNKKPDTHHSETISLIL